MTEIFYDSPFSSRKQKRIKTITSLNAVACIPSHAICDTIYLQSLAGKGHINGLDMRSTSKTLHILHFQ
jgi:hypothetical protein